MVQTARALAPAPSAGIALSDDDRPRTGAFSPESFLSALAMYRASFLRRSTSALAFVACCDSLLFSPSSSSNLFLKMLPVRHGCLALFIFFAKALLEAVCAQPLLLQLGGQGFSQLLALPCCICLFLSYCCGCLHVLARRLLFSFELLDSCLCSFQLRLCAFSGGLRSH